MAMCHMGKRPVQPSNMLYGTTTSLFHLAMCYTVPRPVPFTWPYVMRYHDQCNLAICHTVSQPVYFTWQCVIRYHNQCISPGNVSYGTTTSVFHLAMCYAVPRPVPFTWQCFNAVPRPVQPSNMSCGTTNEEIITNFMTTLSMKMNL